MYRKLFNIGYDGPIKEPRRPRPDGTHQPGPCRMKVR